MTWHDPSTSFVFSSFSMRDLMRPLKRITYLKIRVFSQNWFFGGDICVSGLICLSCSLLVIYITACHIDSFMSNKYVLCILYQFLLAYTYYNVPSKTKHYTRHRQDSISMETAVQWAITQAADWILFCLHAMSHDSTVAVTISSWIARLRLQLPANVAS